LSAQLIRVIDISGEVTIQQPTGDYSGINQGQLLVMTSELKIGDNSSVILELPSGQHLELNSAGIVNLNTLSAPQKDSPASAEDKEAETALSFDPNSLEAPAAGVEQLESAPPLQLAPIITEEDSLLPEIETDSHNSLVSDASRATFNTASESSSLASSSEDQSTNPSIIDGTDSLPESVSLSPIQLTEDRLLVETGSLNQDQFEAMSLTSNYGSFQISENGDWQYQLNNSAEEIQQLGAGDRVEDSISFASQSGQEYKLLVTINGSNDRALLSGNRGGSLNEDDSAIQGTLAVSDKDAGEQSFNAFNALETQYGTASLNAEGTWEYSLDSENDSVQSLREGESISDNFYVSSVDGSIELIRISIEGSNDAPILGGTNTGTLLLGDALETQGSLQIHDLDFNESHFQAFENLKTEFGSASISESGVWSYVADNTHPALNSLGEGEKLYDQFEVLTADGTSQLINLVLKGSSADLSLTASLSTESELYIWTPETEQSETIAQFTSGPNGDTLILQDLLSDTAQTESLDQYLHFEETEGGTRLLINTEGSETPPHEIFIQNLDVSQLGSSDGEIIQSLMNSGNLEVLAWG